MTSDFSNGLMDWMLKELLLFPHPKGLFAQSVFYNGRGSIIFINERLVERLYTTAHISGKDARPLMPKRRKKSVCGGFVRLKMN